MYRGRGRGLPRYAVPLAGRDSACRYWPVASNESGSIVALPGIMSAVAMISEPFGDIAYIRCSVSA